MKCSPERLEFAYDFILRKSNFNYIDGDNLHPDNQSKLRGVQPQEAPPCGSGVSGGSGGGGVSEVSGGRGGSGGGGGRPWRSVL